VKNIVTVLGLFCQLFFSSNSFADDAEKWIKLPDLTKVNCESGISFNLKYDGEVLFSQFRGSPVLREQCNAILMQPKQDSTPLYLKLLKFPALGVDRSLSEVLVPEDGFFVRRQ